MSITYKVSKLKLITKIAGLIAIMLSVSLIVSVVGLYNMKNVSDHLAEIVDVDMPLQVNMGQITAWQLELSAQINRGLMSAELKSWDAYEAADTKLAELDIKIIHQFEVIEENVKKILLRDLGATEKAKYENLLTRLVDAEKSYKVFMDGSNELFSMIISENISIADVDLLSLSQEIEDMPVALIEMANEVGEAIVATAAEAKQNEQRAKIAVITISIVLIFLASVLGLLLLRGVKNQLGGDPMELMDIADSLASGDLSMTLDKSSVGVYGSITNTMVKLIEVIRGITSGANEVKTASEQVSQGNADLSQRTQEQASSLEEIASSMEQMTGTVHENASNAQQAKQFASEAYKFASKGGEVVAHAVTAMNEIEGSSKQITDIIKVIDDIAFQTNLLALNAAVEAARAGDQGRGFAVVAKEVRALAGRSASAAKEIKTLIVDSLTKVKDGTRLVGESGASLEEIIGSVEKVSAIVAEIAIASKEQSIGIEQVNRALTQMDEMTQHNASLVEEAAAASEAMGAQSEELTALVSYFKLHQESVAPMAVKPAPPIQRPVDLARLQGEVSKSQKKALGNQSNEEWQDF